jgi:predicted site-specific integrase-resolvase
MKGYYTVRDVCERFKVARETIRRWEKAGRFPRRIALHDCARGRKLFPIDEVELWELGRREARQATLHVNPLL